MNGIERVETPATRWRDATLLLALWAAMELLLAVIRVRSGEVPLSPWELALRLTVVTLSALGAVAAWRGWRGVRPIVPIVTLVAVVSHAISGGHSLAWSAGTIAPQTPVTEIAVTGGVVAGTLGMGLAVWHLVRRDLT